MAIKNLNDKKMRSLEVVRKTIFEGKTQAEAAKELGISRASAERDMKFYREAEIFQNFRNKMFEELIPLAHEAMKTALEDGDAQVALKIYDAVGLGPQKSQAQAAKNEEEDFYAELAKLRAGALINITPVNGGRQISRIDAPLEPTGAKPVIVSDGLPASGLHGLTENETVEGENGAEVVEETIEPEGKLTDGS